MKHACAVLSMLCAFLVLAGTAFAKPTAVVALGDSAISGESAGNYEPGTDQEGNFCHRSLNALIHKTTIPVDARLNLSCSGAETANLYINGEPQNGEPPQSEKLRQAALAYDIKMVIVEIGANDDPDFGGVVTDCVAQFVFQTGVGCRYTVGPFWQSRVNAMVPKVERALDDVRTVMRNAGYADSSWQPIVASYWSPAPDGPGRYSGYWRKLWEGCPIYDADMDWGRHTAVPVLAAGLRGAASRKGWRYLDFQRSMHGREICARGISHSQEWITGLKYDPFGGAAWYSSDAVRQSFHANARGHAQLGRCVSEFYAQTRREGTCVRGSDGNLHALAL